MQIYVPITERSRVSIPTVMQRVLRFSDHQWLRLTAIGDGKVLLEPVDADVVAPLAAPVAASPADEPPAAGSLPQAS